MLDILNNLRANFNNHLRFHEKRPGVVQVVAPLYHEDGDMIDMFIDLPKLPSMPLRISDYGLTLMRLSYSYDIETPHKQKVFNRILDENGVLEDRGSLYMETTFEGIYPAMLQFAQTIAKVSNMRVFNQAVVQSLFYENLGEFITSRLVAYKPVAEFIPIPSRSDIEVDWKLDSRPRSIYLFGVRNESQVRLAALNCVSLQMAKIPFRSVVVHEDFENGINKKDQARITNVADKQFASLADFMAGAEEYLERETSPSIQ